MFLQMIFLAKLIHICITAVQSHSRANNVQMERTLSWWIPASDLSDWSCGLPPRSPWCDSRWRAWLRPGWWSHVCWPMPCRTRSRPSPSCRAGWLRCPRRLKETDVDTWKNKYGTGTRLITSVDSESRRTETSFRREDVSQNQAWHEPTGDVFSMAGKWDLYYLLWQTELITWRMCFCSGVCKKHTKHNHINPAGPRRINTHTHRHKVPYIHRHRKQPLSLRSKSNFSVRIFETIQNSTGPQK